MFEDFSLSLWIHLGSAVVALVAGAGIFFRPKGTPLHRGWGKVYVAAMTVLLVSVIFVPAKVLPFGNSNFGFFHILLLLGAFSLTLGVVGLILWRKTKAARWLRFHQVNMAYSYAGLVMAGASQMFTNQRFGLADFTEQSDFWIAFAVMNASIYAIAVFLIVTRIQKKDPKRFVTLDTES